MARGDLVDLRSRQRPQTKGRDADKGGRRQRPQTKGRGRRQRDAQTKGRADKARRQRRADKGTDLLSEKRGPYSAGLSSFCGLKRNLAVSKAACEKAARANALANLIKMLRESWDFKAKTGCVAGAYYDLLVLEGVPPELAWEMALKYAKFGF